MSARASLDRRNVEKVHIRDNMELGRLKIFGCVAFVHIMGEKRLKLDVKSRQCIFIGCKQGLKGYKLWGSTLKNVVISWDVVFDEQMKIHKNEKVVVVIDTWTSAKDQVEINVGQKNSWDTTNQNESTVNDKSVDEWCMMCMENGCHRGGMHIVRDDMYVVHERMRHVLWFWRHSIIGRYDWWKDV